MTNQSSPPTSFAEGDSHESAPISEHEAHKRETHRLARLVLATFIFTFVAARILVIFIMAGKLPPQRYCLYLL